MYFENQIIFNNSAVVEWQAHSATTRLGLEKLGVRFTFTLLPHFLIDRGPAASR